MKLLMEEFKLTQEELADRIGKSRSAIANTLRLLSLSPEVIDLITFSEEQMIEKYGSSDISKLTHLVGDVRWREFSSKMENLRKSSLPVDRTAVIQLIEELKQQGLFRVE